MKFVIVLFALAAVCLAKPADVETGDNAGKEIWVLLQWCI